jgi:branched-chain amino acid transport system ATP-binding protein
MSDNPILQVQDVTKAFGGILALSRVTFDLHEGEILGIIGPNGSGKTTLINCITGFINLTAGKVFFRGKDITGKAAHKIADMGITRTFQIMRPYYSLPAYKNLVIPLFSPRAKRTGGWRGGGKLGDRNTVSIDILEEMGFERESFVPYKMASTLPTGYLKRLELARCLSLRPEIILCDEHRLRELFRVANRVMVMNFGEKLIEGTPEEVMADEKVKEAYFGSEKVEEVTGYA